jgi:hypothetical protein
MSLRSREDGVHFESLNTMDIQPEAKSYTKEMDSAGVWSKYYFGWHLLDNVWKSSGPRVLGKPTHQSGGN